MTTINRGVIGFVGLTLYSFAALGAAQTPGRTANGLVIKSTSKLQPPQATLTKSNSQKIDAKLHRARQEREMAQQMALIRATSSSLDARQRITVKGAENAKGSHVKSK